MPLYISGEAVEKTAEWAEKISTYLKTGPQDLEKFDFKEWSEEEFDKITRIIRNTVPDGRLVSEIIGSGSVDSKPASSNSVDNFYEEANQRTTTVSNDTEVEAPKSAPKASKAAPSLDDLYNDL
jgi:hypothetical protein